MVDAKVWAWAASCYAPTPTGRDCLMIVTALAFSGLALVLTGWVHYLWLIPQERVPVAANGHRAALALGAALAVAAIAVAGAEGGILLAIGTAAVSIPAAAGFFYLLSIAPLPDGQLAVTVSDRLPAFAATTHAGDEWSSDSLAHGRVLLKFFRGGW